MSLYLITKNSKIIKNLDLEDFDYDVSKQTPVEQAISYKDKNYDKSHKLWCLVSN